ncbi:TPA: hypothetical protein ACFNZI_000270 [Neisseria meningitidis]|nr:hypothetical protein [Neisseria meningitidis]
MPSEMRMSRPTALFLNIVCAACRFKNEPSGVQLRHFGRIAADLFRNDC